MLEPVHAISHLFGVSSESVIASAVIFMMISNLIGRFIPDSATGYLGITRKVFKILGLYVGNRIFPGITVSEMAMSIPDVVTDQVDDQIEKRVIPEVTRVVQNTNPFTGRNKEV